MDTRKTESFEKKLGKAIRGNARKLLDRMLQPGTAAPAEQKRTACGKPGMASGEKSRTGTSAGANAVSQLRPELLKLMRGALWGIFAFLTGNTVLALGFAPMGYAILGSMLPAEHMLFAYLGVVLSALFGKTSAVIPVAVMTAMTLVRFLLPRVLSAEKTGRRPFSEPTLIRYTVTVVSAFAAGMLQLISGGFLWYDLFSLLFAVSVVPFLTMLLDFALDPERKYTLSHELGQTAMVLAVIFSLRGAYIFGFSLSTCAAFLITMYVSKTGGILRGGVTGFLAGLLCRIGYAPVMGLGGLVAGLFWNVSAVVSVTCACIVGIALGIFADGFPAAAVLAPDLLGAAAVFLPFAQFGLLPRFLNYANQQNMPETAMTNGIISSEAEKNNQIRLTALSDAMKELSEVFYNLSDRLRRPGIFDVLQSCERCYRTHCSHCGLNTVCWVREHSQTSEAMNRIAAALHKNGTVTRADVPEALSARCRETDRILSDVNCAHISQLEESASRDKLEVIALDYESMAKLLSESGRLTAEETAQDVNLTRKARKMAKYLGFHAAAMSVYGKRRLGILAGGVDLSRVHQSSAELSESFGKVCGVKFGAPRFHVEDDYITMTMTAARKFTIEAARSSCCKDDEKINGDSICIFENREDYFYTLLSDGMGSGREAALTSRMVSVFLETMLRAGNPKNVVLQMLNNFIRNKNLECFATVDLIEIDLLSGRTVFIKGGAAPSYILRDGKLFKIASSSLPIGITREISAEEIRFDLEPDDIIVMVSDGVAASFEDSIWLADMLTFDWKDDDTLFSMCEKILSAARNNNERSDDMTVAMLRVGETEGTSAS